MSDVGAAQQALQQFGIDVWTPTWDDEPERVGAEHDNC